MNKKYFNFFIFLTIGILLVSCTIPKKNPVPETFNGLEKIDDAVSYFIYVDDGGGVWYSDKDKSEFTKLKNDLSFEKTYNRPSISKIGLVKDGKIWAFRNNLLAKNEDGSTWECYSKENFVNCNTNIYEYDFNSISSIEPKDNSIFIGTYNGIYRSTDQGGSWQRVYFDENDQSLNEIFDILNHNGILYASAQMNLDDPYSNIGYGILESLDNGDTWKRSLVNRSTVYFVGGHDGNLYAYSRDYNFQWIFWTKNSNADWKLTSYLPDIKDEGKGNCDFKFTTLKNGEIFGSCSLLVSEYRGGDFPTIDYLGVYIIKSYDNGSTWKIIDFSNKMNYVFDLDVLNSGDVIMSTDKGIFKMDSEQT